MRIGNVEWGRPPLKSVGLWAPLFLSLVACFSCIQYTMRALSSSLQSEMDAAFQLFPTARSLLSYGATSLDADQQRIVNVLEQLPIKYYVYDHPDILQLDQFWNTSVYNSSSMTVINQQEIAFIDAFLDHPTMRTRNASEASFFVVPFPLRVASPDQVMRLMNALAEHPLFQQYPQGHHHLFFAIEGRILEEVSGWPLPKATIRRMGRILSRSTMIKKFDIMNCVRMHQDNVDHGDWNSLWKSHKPYYGHSVGPGLLVAPDLPLVTPTTYEQWSNKPTVLFYHTRKEGSVYGSTEYRKAPLKVADRYPFDVSIGYDMPYEEWKAAFMNSRFCLAIRGDDPATSAFLRAVKVGCLPLVVSDYMPRYAPNFPHILNPHDFAIFVPESAFMADPLGSLSTVIQETPRAVVEAKLANLTFAQRILFSEHDESLFVPALLYEAALVNDGPESIPALPRTFVEY